MANTINQNVVIWARGQIGKQVGKGECWDLADKALRNAGASSSADLGPMGDDEDYIWGDAVDDLKDAQAGDVLQFRDFTVATSIETDISFADGSRSTDTKESEFTRPHHTAVIDTAQGQGAFKILEQNVAPGGKKVQLHTLNTRDNVPVVTTTRKLMKAGDGTMKMATVKVTTTITVSGTIWAYRPKKP